MKLSPLLILCCALALPAFADEPRPASAPTPPKPCQRGTSTMRMSGLDMDEIRCAGWVQEQQIIQLTLQLSQYEVKLRMLTEDLAAAQAKLSAPPPATPAPK